MVIYNLKCVAGHLFEGWFESPDDFSEQQTSGQVECPVCGVPDVEKQPHATALAKSAPKLQDMSPQQLQAQVRETMFRIAASVKKNTEDVGSEFATEATRIHRGETQQRPIRGTATREEEKQLDSEGVPYVRVPLPEYDA